MNVPRYLWRMSFFLITFLYSITFASTFASKFGPAEFNPVGFNPGQFQGYPPGTPVHRELPPIIETIKSLKLEGTGHTFYLWFTTSPDYGWGWNVNQTLLEDQSQYDGVHSPEFLAYTLKVSHLVNGTQPEVVRLVIGKGRYMLVLYDDTSAGIYSYTVTAAMQLSGPSSKSAKDLTSQRINACFKYRNPKNGAMSCLSSFTPESTATLEQTLGQELATITNEIRQHIPSYMASGVQPQYSALWNSITTAVSPYTYGQSVGKLSGYYQIVKYMLESAPFPMSDTSDTMFGIDSGSFYNHPLYLYFSANKFARGNFLSSVYNTEFQLLIQTVLLHRYKELDDQVYSESMNNNQAYDDYYEFIVIMNKLLPQNKDLSTGIKDWDQGNAATKFMAVDPQVIVNARKIIEKSLPNAIDNIYTQGIITVGKLFTAPPAGQASRGPQFVAH